MEIGAHAIKAIRLEREGDSVRVTDFAHIPHRKVLTTPDLDQDEMIRLSLGQLVSQKSLEGEHLVMSVPGHSAFARFAKLPPVEPKKVPDIVKFEAVQQIPFPIEQVEWDYQTFTSDDSPEIEVGIFAITRERVQHQLSLYGDVGISPEMLSLSPVSVYNAMAYDLQLEGTKDPVVFLDIGTQATDVIVAEEGRCWIRTFPLGGTHFTEAIASAFKLGYSKAEKLKQEAATSKYAKQIMQAMRPVFTDLLQDLQRSIGYYQSLHPEIELKTMVGLGSTFKIPGLRKFLGQQLQIDVVRLDEFKRIAVAGREAASFAENAVNMATAYGLAIQGVGLARIDANIMPVGTLRDQLWHAKTKWFAAAAAVVIAGAGMTLYRPLTDGARLSGGGVPQVVTDVLRQGETYKDEYQTLQSETNIGETVNNMVSLLDYRDIWPHVVSDAASALAAAEPAEELRDGDPEAIYNADPLRRRVIHLRELRGDYLPPTAEDGTRRIRITMSVELSDYPWDVLLNDTVGDWLREHAEPEGDRADVPYRIVESSVRLDSELVDILHMSDSGQQQLVKSGGGERKSRGPTGSGSGSGSRGGDDGGLFVGGSGGGGGALRSPTGDGAKVPGGSGSGGGLFVGGPGGKQGRPTGDDRDPSGTGRTGRPSSGDLPRFPTGSDQPGLTRGPLDQRAPIEDAPPLYPPDTDFYRVPVTFTIEILDAKIKPAETEDVAARPRDGEVTS
jgi:type IV pilus assembly protein PilM